MVRQVRDPGIDVPPRRPQPLPPALGSLAKMDARARQSRVAKGGVKCTVAASVTLETKRGVENWAGDAGKPVGGLLRDLIEQALLCRQAGFCPTAVLYDAAHKERGAP